MARTTTSSTSGGGEERRAREIMTWCKQHPQAITSGYIVLDDLDLDSVAAPPAWEPVIPRGHFLRISDQTGLTKADAGHAIGSRSPRRARLCVPLPTVPQFLLLSLYDAPSSFPVGSRCPSAQCLAGATLSFRRFRNHS